MNELLHISNQYKYLPESLKLVKFYLFFLYSMYSLTFCLDFIKKKLLFIYKINLLHIKQITISINMFDFNRRR